jgi:hypothetical protein
VLPSTAVNPNDLLGSLLYSTPSDEVRVGNHHKQIARYFADKLILAAAVAGGAQNEPVDTGRIDVVLVGVGVKFNGHIGDTRFAAIQKTIVVGILPDFVPNGEGSKRKAEVEGAVVGTSVADTESDHAHICAVHNLGDAVAVTRVAVSRTRTGRPPAGVDVSTVGYI